MIHRVRVSSLHRDLRAARALDQTAGFLPNSGELLVRFPVEPEYDFRATYQNGPADEVRLVHHHVDGLFLRFRQRPLLENRTARADEVEKPRVVDVLLEERSVWRSPVDVALVYIDVLLLQITSGVAAGRSRRFPIEDRLRHGFILVQVHTGLGGRSGAPPCS
jgi:hypothetical protein